MGSTRRKQIKQLLSDFENFGGNKFSKVLGTAAGDATHSAAADDATHTAADDATRENRGSPSRGL